MTHKIVGIYRAAVLYNVLVQEPYVAH